MSLLVNGLSGALGARAALDAASQNLANAQTQGYSRQGAVLVAVGPSRSGIVAGDGVRVSSLMRFSDSYKTQQMWRAASTRGEHEAAQQYLLQLEQVLADDKGSVNAGLDQFFGALSAASVEPTSSPLRHQIIGAADALAQRFNSLRSVLASQRTAVQQQRATVVMQANALTSEIAQLNEKVATGRAGGLNTAALLDQRDAKVDALAALVGVQTVEQPDGWLDVSLRSGQPLVVRAQASTLEVADLEEGVQGLRMRFANESFSLNSENLGGALGGLHDYEARTLRQNDQALVDMASAVSGRVNDILRSGYGMAGQPGVPLFVFDASSSSRMLSIDESVQAEDLGLSADASRPGNSQRLLELIDLQQQPIAVGSLGNVLVGDAYTQLLGRLSIRSQQNQASLQTAATVREQAEKNWQSTSGVNTDEEAINLVQYQQMYQANMKVIAVANELFDSVLNLS